MIVKKTLALRGTPELVAVLNNWGSSSRPMAVKDIVSYVSDLSEIPQEEAKAKLKNAYNMQRRIDISNVLPDQVPSQIKIVVEVEEEQWEKAMNLFKTVFGLGNHQPQMPFFIKTGGIACINDMETEKTRPKTVEESSGDLTIPEMAKRFAEVLLDPTSHEYYLIERILSAW